MPDSRWTAPAISVLRGEDASPLRAIFSSLSDYLYDVTSSGQTSVMTIVRNGEATSLQAGEVVYVSGRQGNRAEVKRASNSSEATSSRTIGVVAATIAANSDGNVVTQGYLSKLNTNGFTEGATVYLGSTAGTFTQTKPAAPNHLVYVGTVVRANAGNGILYVRAQNGYELDEIHDVQIATPANDQLLVYESSTSLWKNKSILPAGSLQMYAPTVTQSTTGGVVTTTAPSGWLLCNGDAVSRATYSALFTAIGTTYGAGDGVNTFNLPDMRSRSALGAGQGTGLSNRALASTGGAETVTLTAAQSGTTAHGHGHALTVNSSDGTHGHTVSDPTHNHSSPPLRQTSSTSHTHTGTQTVAAGFTATDVAINTGSSGTGISLSAGGHTHAVTGTISNATAANAASSHENMMPFLAVNFLIKT